MITSECLVNSSEANNPEYHRTKNGDSVLRVALNLEVSGKRKRGRPRMTWKKQVEEETEKIGLKKEDALRQDKWRDGVRAIAKEMG